MTSAEQRTWRSVATETQAIDFIDLFWARRDPTPGTSPNENRVEFDRRVAYADRAFMEGKRRGALTERGRVLILLGFPTEMSGEAGTPMSQHRNDSGAGGGLADPTGGRALAAKDTWTYTHEQAVKYNVPKVEVVFIHDGMDGGAHRDPQRTDFGMTLPGAIASWIITPDLATVPQWASSRLQFERTVPAPAGEQLDTSLTIRKVTKGQAVVDVPAPVAKPAGIGTLILLDDSMALQPQSGSDPLAPVASVTRFKRGRELGWAVQYCSGEISKNSTPPLKVQLRVNAPNGDSFSTDAEEFVPDSIKAAPGCYLLRGALPLAEIAPGAYVVTVTITGAAGGRSYNLTRDFRVE